MSEPADALCDMGGGLIAAVAAAGYRPAGAVEATTAGLHRLAGLARRWRHLGGGGCSNCYSAALRS